MARAEQEGKNTGSSAAKKIAKSMSPTKLDHFAKTKEKGLPEHVKKRGKK